MEMVGSNKLYRVTLRGTTYSFSRGGMDYATSYVIAEDPSQAYEKVKKKLDEYNVGSSNDRELDKIELLASDHRFNNIQTLLYL